jgi:hypothetical protein
MEREVRRPGHRTFCYFIVIGLLALFAETGFSICTFVNPAFADPNLQTCVSVYDTPPWDNPGAAADGKPLASSEEVDAEHAWPKLLAGAIRCRVDNYGVGGYGTGQAYLRYRQNVTVGKESAPIVVITVFTRNVMENVNAIKLTAAYVAQFRDYVLRDGRTPFVVIIPNCYELEYYNRHHIWVDQTLLDALAQHNISAINFGTETLGLTSGSDLSSLYRAGGEHLNERGYALLAEIVQRHLAPKLKQH